MLWVWVLHGGFLGSIALQSLQNGNRSDHFSQSLETMWSCELTHLFTLCDGIGEQQQLEGGYNGLGDPADLDSFTR